MTSRPLVLTFSAVALLLGLMAPPAAGTAEAQARTRFEGMDRNNDGRITREEWRGSDRSFENHDWNGDGVLSGDEVRPGRAAQQQLGDGRSRSQPLRAQHQLDRVRIHAISTTIAMAA